MDGILHTIRHKLSRGEKLSINDLCSLEPVHDAIYNTGNGRDDDYDGIEFLDRSFLRRQQQQQQQQQVNTTTLSRSKNLPPLVHYVGMVQDMLDPEYYESTDGSGRSTHFVDHDNDLNQNNKSEYNENDNDENQHDRLNRNRNECLAERIPLVVLPIPFASDWLLNDITRCRQNNRLGSDDNKTRGGKTKSVVFSPMSTTVNNQNRGERKRVREDDSDHDNDHENKNKNEDDIMKGDDDDDDDDDDGDKKNTSSRSRTMMDPPSNSTNKKISTTKKIIMHKVGIENENDDSSINNLTTTDWWPAGCCGTLSEYCPVLAKLCYDQLLVTSSSSSHKQNDERTEEQIEEGETKDSTVHSQTNTTMGGGSQRQQQQQQKRVPLKLNDIVSLVGVLSMNPWEANFSGQRPSSSSCVNSSKSMIQGNDDGIKIDNHSYYCVGDTSSCEGLYSTTTLLSPPPSRLPRLHVLSYRQIDLDDLAQQAMIVANKKRNKMLDGDEVLNNSSTSTGSNCDDVQKPCHMEEEDSKAPIIRCGRPISLGEISSLMDPLSLSLSSTSLWTRALYLCLLSDAEQQQQQPNNYDDYNETSKTATTCMIRAGPSERALGCFSLRLSTPDVTSSKALFRRLAEDILLEICPIVAVIDLTTTTTTKMIKEQYFSFSPRKDSQGRLRPCPLQLPRGPVSLIHYPPYIVTKSNNSCSSNSRNNNNSNGRYHTTHSMKINENNQDEQREREIILRELVQYHRLPYQFEGGVVIPFEADYRIIVVTTQTQELPCTLSVLATTETGPLSTSTTTTSSPITTATTTIPSKLELREILIKGRSSTYDNNNKYVCRNNKNVNLQFSSTLLQRAQQDFLERRQRCHESAASTLPGEEDFHRWLLLSRLHAKIRRSVGGLSPNLGSESKMAEEEGQHSFNPSSNEEEDWEPTMEDWEAALQLDDTIRDMV